MAGLIKGGQTVIVPDETVADYISQGWSPVDVPEPPSEEWSHGRLDEYAARVYPGVTVKGTKAEKVAALQRAATGAVE